MNLLQIQPNSARLNTGRTIQLRVGKQERRDRVIMEPRCTDRGGKTVVSFQRFSVRFCRHFETHSTCRWSLNRLSWRRLGDDRLETGQSGLTGVLVNLGGRRSAGPLESDCYCGVAPCPPAEDDIILQRLFFSPGQPVKEKDRSPSLSSLLLCPPLLFSSSFRRHSLHLLSDAVDFMTN